MIETFKTLLINNVERTKIRAMKVEAVHQSNPKSGDVIAATVYWEVSMQTEAEGLPVPTFKINQLEIELSGIKGHDEGAVFKPKEIALKNWVPNDQHCHFKGWRPPAGLTVTKLVIDFKRRSVLADFGEQ